MLYSLNYLIFNNEYFITYNLLFTHIHRKIKYWFNYSLDIVCIIRSIILIKF